MAVTDNMEARMLDEQRQPVTEAYCTPGDADRMPRLQIQLECQQPLYTAWFGQLGSDATVPIIQKLLPSGHD